LEAITILHDKMVPLQLLKTKTILDDTAEPEAILECVNCIDIQYRYWENKYNEALAIAHIDKVH